MDDGVTLTSVAHPVPQGLGRAYWLAVRFWRWLTWPIRKHRIIEEREIEITGGPKGLIIITYKD